MMTSIASATSAPTIKAQLDEDMDTVVATAKFMHPHALPRLVDDLWSRANGSRSPGKLGPFNGSGAWDTAVVTSAALAAGLGYASYPIVLPAAAALTALGTGLALGRAGFNAVGEGISVLAAKMGITEGRSGD